MDVFRKNNAADVQYTTRKYTVSQKPDTPIIFMTPPIIEQYQ